MSAENLEIVRRLHEAFDRGDLETQFELFAPDVEITEWPDAPDSRTYRGHAGVMEAYNSWYEAWEWVRHESVDLVDLGDRVLDAGRTRGKGKGSSVEVSLDAFNVFTLRDGKVVRLEFFTDRERALRAAGLGGAELEESR
jgi:ketosteroid isomerase-like protein